MDRSNVQGFPLRGKEGGRWGGGGGLMPKIPNICVLLDTHLTKKMSPLFPTCPLKEYILEKKVTKSF